MAVKAAMFSGQENHVIEAVKPDYQLAFSQLSVGLVEATAHLEHGDTERAIAILRRSRHIVEFALNPCGILKADFDQKGFLENICDPS